VTVVVRRARTADVPAIKSIVDIYAGSGRKLLAKELVALYEDVQDFQVAEIDGAVVGCGALHVLWADLGEIRTLAVHPERRETGIGATVLAALVGTARELLEQAAAGGAGLRLPIDVVIVAEPRAGASTSVVPWTEIPDDRMVVDVGPATVAAMAADVAAAGTVMWNGPLGIYEIEAFAAGTRGVAEAVGRSAATTVIGGGDLAAAIEDAGVAGSITHMSTGGGATLEFLEGRVLPGVAALRDRVAP